MSIRQGNKVLSAGQSLTQNLFDFKWADHILDDIQWLRADTFTWHDGRVYEAAYQHLLAEWNEVGDVPSTEIIAGTQIYYRLAPDGHKICSASQEDEAIAIYEATGIAWYYILDTTNQRFKLPRTKFGFVGLRDNDVGKYIQSEKVLLSSGSGVADYTEVNKATQMYLYFFVGNFSQSAVVNTAGINATLVDEIQGECIDLQNNKQDIATAVNYNNITNCITEIPQDIKLEISGGSVKLKAGSKVWYPNGPNVFSSLTASSDITISPTGGSGKCLICVNVTNDVIQAGMSNSTNNCVSGPGVEHRDYGMCYDTTTNIIQRWGDPGVLNATKASFPLALVTQTDGAITSIDQVFNGFGYIGSTVFALPGVKGLIPDGRNADGTLKNTLLTKQSVNVFTPSSATFSQITNIALGSTLSYHTFTYDEVNNKTSASGYMNAGDITWTNGKITSFAPKTAFHAVDYSDLTNILETIYPIGAIYIGTQNTCPMSAFFGTWTLVSSGKALWTGTGSNGNSTINAGLPNITGSFSTRDAWAQNSNGAWGTKTGAFSSNTGTYSKQDASISGGYGPRVGNLTFKASDSNSIYGASSTVQPPAYVVNVWRRTA